MGDGLASLALATEYRTGEDDLARDFFAPCLRHASHYDRGVGYFRSSAFLVLGESIVDFALRGGQMRFVCSPELSEEDLAALDRGYDRRLEIIDSALLRDIALLLGGADSRGPTELLATLIAVGVLDVRIAIRPPAQGIYHEKLGLFLDQFGNAITFKGSANESWRALHGRGNLESIEVFWSWGQDSDANRVRRHRQYFERLWGNEVSGVEVIPMPDASKRSLLKVAHITIADAATASRLTGATVNNARPLSPHQLTALANWEAAGSRGVLRHATGSGKTLTAISAIRKHSERGLPTLVLVPSVLLLGQWRDEVSHEIPSATILLCGGGHAAWQESRRLESFTSPRTALGARVTISTMATAATETFRKKVSQGDHLLIVADEVHQTGSPENRKIFSIVTGPRLGLSATPERFGDPEGTAQLFGYFGPVVPPEVTLRDAIAAGRLVEYCYYPTPLALSDDESDLWKDLTIKISQEIARSHAKKNIAAPLSDRTKLLLIQRARIAKKARAKLPYAVRTIRNRFAEGERWLVYCEDLEQLGALRALLTSEGIAAGEYFSGMAGDPRATLKWFAEFGGVLLSVRCLDEGVDIPSVTHALILASSQNPRQFIQRRGRVLRRSPGKYQATIFDAIVAPPHIAGEPFQASLARSEIARALVFAEGALNLDAAAALRHIAAEIGLDDINVAVEVEDTDSTRTDNVSTSITEADT